MTSRIEEIRKLLFTYKKVLVNDLSARFNISCVTIRKDLQQLEDEGIAKRIYGGAILADYALPSSLSNESDKTRIALAERACDEIRDGDSIFLGSGKTCCYLAKLLERFNNLSIVTNNITALNDLLKTDSRVYLLGGEVTSTDAHTLFSCPENPNTFTNHIFVSKAFTSISGIDLQAGLTVHSIVSTHIYHKLTSIARSWYLMADNHKFGQIAMYPVADLNAFQYIIADSMPEPYHDIFKKNDTRILWTKDHLPNDHLSTVENNIKNNQ